jgi:hypothetical protein
MEAFRKEIKHARSSEQRLHKFVPSRVGQDRAQREIEERANDIFGIGVAQDPTSALTLLGAASEDDDDFDYWPDELVPLGIAMDDAGQAGTTSSSTPPTEDDSSSTPPTDSATEPTDSNSDEDNEEDLWPLELLVG